MFKIIVMVNCSCSRIERKEGGSYIQCSKAGGAEGHKWPGGGGGIMFEIRAKLIKTFFCIEIFVLANY